MRRLLDRPEPERKLGPFALVKPLGSGGFAPVWLAREMYGDTLLRLAAVKLFALGGTGGTQERARRIVEEAQALCRVEHPNVVRFYALPIDEGLGVMGLAMEHVAGTTLDERLSQRGQLSAEETLEVGLSVASALGAVHRAGLVHRDVKPANVVEAAGVTKLIDFGIAAADAPATGLGGAGESGGGSGQGGTGQILHLDDLPLELPAEPGATLSALGAGGSSSPLPPGTAGYMDPRCVARRVAATAASDLYGLGALLYVCLTGRLPSAGEEGLRPEVLDGSEPAPAVRSLSAETPEGLGALVDALLAVEPARRPASAEAVVVRLEQARAELAGRQRALPPEEVGPFRGLLRFEEGDRDLYFGRTAEVAAALEVLRGRGLAALVGPSGSGKSSLARAGVVPAVSEGALGGWPAAWDAAVVTPGRDPRGAIVGALRELGIEAGGEGPEALLSSASERSERSGRGLLLVVDQLEELSTLSPGPGRDWTAALLGRLGERPQLGLRALVTARRDLLDPLLALPSLGQALVRGSVLLEPLGGMAWAEALGQALGAYGYQFEDEALQGEVLGQLEGVAMPLVQFALAELWRMRDRERRLITRQGLASIGGIAGALERHAEGTVEPLLARGAEGAVRATLLGLTTARGTRAARTEAELREQVGAVADEVLGALDEARLVVRSPSGVQIAHEALLGQWGRLRSWVAEAREQRLLVEELEADAKRWSAAPDAAPLWQRRRLAWAEALCQRPEVRVSEQARVYVRAGRKAERRGRLLAGGAAALLLASIGLSGAYFVQARIDMEQQRRANAEERNQLVQAKQAEIDQLLAKLKEGPAPAVVSRVEELRGEIKQLAPAAGSSSAAGASPPRPPPAPTSVAAAPRPPAVVTAPTSTAAAAPTAPAQTEVKPVPSW